MRVPIICADARLCQFSATFRACFSKPQRRYFEIVLLALLLCQEAHTLTGLLRCVLGRGSLAGLSRFLSTAPWSPTAVANTWRIRFDAQVTPLVAAEHARQRATRPLQPGRPPTPVVTGYLIGDDSTMHKVRGKKMAGLGWHYSTTAGTRVVGHSLVQGLYLVQGRQCPLEPRLYRQQAVCQGEGVPFQSKIELMAECIQAFTPLAHTTTHVLLDSWYAAKRIWQVARQRGFLITTGVKSNRALRVADPDAPRGWRWQRLPDYVAGLTDADYQPLLWPSQGETLRQVWVHVVTTRVRTLYCCQVIIVRTALDAPLAQTRYWASSDLAADGAQLLAHLATRWAIEVCFADCKELLGLDQYQVLSARALQRFWTLVLAAYVVLDEERARLRQQRQQPVTLGEARRVVQQAHWYHLIHWMHDEFQAGTLPQVIFERLAA